VPATERVCLSSGGALMIRLKAEFCVVGAGYAGLAAAYRLQETHKKSVIVLEAGGHPGGRVWTENLSDGTWFDIGGAWVANESAQPDIRKLMRELKVEPYPQFTHGSEGRTIFVCSDGKITYYKPLSEKSPLEQLPTFRKPEDELDVIAEALNCAAQLDVGAAITTLNAMSDAVNREKPWEDVPFDPLLLTAPKSTREADQMTVQTWMDRTMSTADAKTLLGN